MGLGTFIASLGLTWLGRILDLAGNRRTGVAIAFPVQFGPLPLRHHQRSAHAALRLHRHSRFGQGALTLVSSTAVANWFRSRRGSMMAYLALAYALFQAYM